MIAKMSVANYFKYIFMTVAGKYSQAVRIPKEFRFDVTEVEIFKRGNNDLWIAAHARTASHTIVSNNVKAFERVSNLKLENWV